MKTRFILLFLLINFSLGAMAQNRKVGMNILTFNIRLNTPADSQYSWPNRKKLAAEMIKKTAADIFCVQEALHNQMIDLNTLLPKYLYAGVGRENGKTEGEYSAIFYDSVRFEKIAGSTFWLSETTDVPGSKSWQTACTRVVTWVKLKDFRANKIFFIFNTHFDHQSKKAQKESAKLLIKKAKEIAGNSFVILTGDFNVTEKDTAYQILVDLKTLSNFIDTKSLSKKPHIGPDFTFVGFPYKAQKGNTIDHIFVKNNTTELVSKHETITFNKNGFYPSDHLPVFVKFIFQVDVKLLDENNDLYMR